MFGIIQTITSPFKGIINGIISGINILISGLNRIKITIPTWSPINPGATLSFNIPKMNYFKDGAALYEETVGVMAEYPGARTNPEIVSPKNLMYSTMRQAIKDSDNEGKDVHLRAETTLKVNGKTMARETIEDFNDEAIRRGFKPILQKG